MKNRIEHIDIAKGVSISLVVMFHSHLKFLFPEIIEPMSLIRMPLFFFLSGVFFSASIQPKIFLIKKSEALLKPYFSILLLMLFFSFLLNKEGLGQELFGIFYGNGDTIRWKPMWFLTHLFVLYCFSYALIRYAGFNKHSPLIKWICLLLFLTIGALNIDVFWNMNLTVSGHSVELVGLPFSLDIILITSAFFIAGSVLKDRAINFTPNKLLIILSVSVFLSIALFTDAHIDFNKRIYTNPVFSTLGAISGIYIVLYASHLLTSYNKIKNILVVLGSSSLYILIFHYSIGRKVYRQFDDYVTDNVGVFILSLIAFMLSIALPLAIKWAVNRNHYLALFFLPFQSRLMRQRERSMRH